MAVRKDQSSGSIAETRGVVIRLEDMPTGSRTTPTLTRRRTRPITARPTRTTGWIRECQPATFPHLIHVVDAVLIVLFRFAVGCFSLHGGPYGKPILDLMIPVNLTDRVKYIV
jgi:hypothetical protein